MASKRPNPTSSSEELDDQNEKVNLHNDLESEEDETQMKKRRSIPNLHKDEGESDPESDSDSKSPSVSGFTIKPRTSASKSAAKPKKPNANPLDEKDRSPSPVKLKRPAETSEKENKTKKAKTVVAGSRLFSEDDEITILKGMIDFRDKKGVFPNSDSDAFYEFLKMDLSVRVTKIQLMDKVSKLKNKYRSNADKCGVLYSKPHDLKLCKLWKKIWGGNSDGNDNGRVEAPPKTEIVGDLVKGKNKAEAAPSLKGMKQEEGKVVEVEERKFSDLYPFMNLSMKTNNLSASLFSKDTAEAMGDYLMLVEKSKLEELENEWKKQVLDEAQLQMRRSALLHKQGKLVCDWLSRKG